MRGGQPRGTRCLSSAASDVYKRQFYIDAEMPAGTAIERTGLAMREVENVIKEKAEISKRLKELSLQRRHLPAKFDLSC